MNPLYKARAHRDEALRLLREALEVTTYKTAFGEDWALRTRALLEKFPCKCGARRVDTITGQCITCGEAVELETT